MIDQALDPVARDGHAVAARCGIIRTSEVNTRTTLVVARFRFHLRAGGVSTETMLCEEIVPLACSGPPPNLQWLHDRDGERLLAATPEENLIPTAIEQQLNLLTDALPFIQKALAAVAQTRAAMQLEAHRRVRDATRTRGKVTVEPVLPVDILGAYILLPRL
jgi:hypothetical protein